MPGAAAAVAYAVQVAALLGFVGLGSFFAYQFRKKRCKWEVLFVCSASFCFTLMYHVFHNDLPFRVRVEGMPEGRSVPWIRFAGYLVTCPVLLLHLSNLRGKQDYDTIRAMQLVGLFQFCVLLGVSSALCIETTPKLVFYLAGWVPAAVLYWRVSRIFVEAFHSFPLQAHGHLVALAFCFYVGWTGFGISFFAGPEGWALIDSDVHDIIVRLSDILAKHVYASVGWSLRWRVLYPLAEMGIIEQTSSGGFSDTAKQHRRPKVLFIASRAVHSNPAVIKFWKTRLAACGADIQPIASIEAAKQCLAKDAGSYAMTLVDIDDITDDFKDGTMRKVPLVAFNKRGENLDAMELLNTHSLDDAIFAPYLQEDVSAVAKFWIVRWYGKQLERDPDLPDKSHTKADAPNHNSFSNVLKSGTLPKSGEGGARWISPSTRVLTKLMSGDSFSKLGGRIPSIIERVYNDDGSNNAQREAAPAPSPPYKADAPSSPAKADVPSALRKAATQPSHPEATAPSPPTKAAASSTPRKAPAAARSLKPLTPAASRKASGDAHNNFRAPSLASAERAASRASRSRGASSLDRFTSAG